MRCAQEPWARDLTVRYGMVAHGSKETLGRLNKCFSCPDPSLVSQHSHPRRLGGSAVQFQRKAAGAGALAHGPFRERRAGGGHHSEDQSGTTRRNDWHHPLPGESLHEQVQEAGLLGVQRWRGPRPQLPPQYRPPRLSALLIAALDAETKPGHRAYFSI